MKYDIKGMDNLLAKLSTLSDDMQKKHVWGAALAGAKVIQKQVTDNARRIDKPGRPGEKDTQIFKHVRTGRGSKIARQEPGMAAYRVGISGGASGKEREPYPTYWRHVEFGTEDTPAQPFVRPALAQSAEAATNRVAKSLWDRISNEVDKGSK